MDKTNEKKDDLCMAPLPGWAVERRKGKAGRDLDYVSQYYVIRRLSEIFGSTGWSARTVRCDLRDLREVSTPQGMRWSVIYEATVEIEAGGSIKSGSAAGSGLDATLAHAVHSALTEAETDALKRAARLLGDNLGLALYDREQRHVDRGQRRREVRPMKKAEPSNVVPLPKRTPIQLPEGHPMRAELAELAEAQDAEALIDWCARRREQLAALEEEAHKEQAMAVLCQVARRFDRERIWVREVFARLERGEIGAAPVAQAAGASLGRAAAR